jgi:hypothetical protein
MPERWRDALGRVDEIGPDSALLERARGGPQRPAPGARPSSRLVAGVVAFAVFAAAGLFAFRALDPQGVTPGGQTAGASQVLWPERVVSEAKAVQAQVDAGDPTVQWRIDPKEVATRFGSKVLGWGDGFAVRPVDESTGGMMSFELEPAPVPCPSPAPGDTVSFPCLTPVATTVTLVQPAARGATGVWSVSSVAATGVSVDVQPRDAVGVGATVTADVGRPVDGVTLSMGLIVEDGVKGVECSRDDASGPKHGQLSIRLTGPILCGANPIGYAYVAELRRNAQLIGGIVPPFDPLHPTKLWGSVLGLSIVPVTIEPRTTSPDTTTDTPTPSASYFVHLPDQPLPIAGSNAGTVRIVAPTNLPDGTLFSTSTDVYGSTPGTSASGEGSSGDSVKDGTMTFTIGNHSCNGLVGAIGDSAGFAVTVTASAKPVGNWSGNPPPQQPDSVVQILGPDFENLTGDQVVVNHDGSKSLVATATYTWPQPQCGSDAFPLWGGPDCQPQQGQLQGDSLKEAMGEVMGALSQARMCEFWGLELTPDVATQHPWAGFSSRWRDWYTNPPKDFSDANSSSSWDQPPFTWHETGQNGDRHFVDVTDHGQVILSLEVDALPNYCPNCSQNVVPFWGVVDWTFH